MNYFQYFPTVYYTFTDPALNDFSTFINIFVRVKAIQSVLDNIQTYYTYQVQDGERPDIIAEKYYSDPQRDWIILLANKILDPYFQWVMDQQTFLNYVNNVYGSVDNAESTIDHYEKHTNITTTQYGTANTWVYVDLIPVSTVSVDGISNVDFPTIENSTIQIGSNVVVSFSDGTVDTSEELVAVSGYTQLFNQNESNRTIKLIDATYASQIEQEFQQLLNQ